MILRTEIKEVNPHLERKRYWEAKARDAREDHDDMREANDSLLRPRTQTISMRPDVKVGINWKNRKIMRERELQNYKTAQRAYDVKYDIVESNPKVAVCMQQQVAVQESLRRFPY